MIHVEDITWNLRILITDLQVEKTLRVKGDLHIGGVMLKLSKTEGEFLLSIVIIIIIKIRKKLKNQFQENEIRKRTRIDFIIFKNNFLVC